MLFRITIILSFLLFGFSVAQEQFSLEDCIQIALENNSALKNAQYNNESADYDVTGSYSGILPRLDVSFRKGESTIGRSERIINDAVIGVDPVTQQPIYGTATIRTPKQYSKDHSLTFTANQTLFDGGGWWNTIKQAKTNKLSSDYNLESEQNNIIFDVQNNYYNLLKQLKLYEVYKVAVQRSQDQLTRTEKMFELGSKARLDVYQAKVNLGNDRINLLTQQNTVEDARRNLNIVMGREPNEPLEVSSEKEVDADLAPLESLLEDANENQPVIKKNEQDLESSDLGISLAKAPYYPSISAYFQYNRRNSDLEKIYSDLNLEYIWAVGIQLNWNIFRGFDDYVNVQKSKINKKIVQENSVNYLRTLKSQIEGYYENYKSYKEIIEINQENLEAAKEELRLAQERYQIGAGTALEVREAQVKLTRAEETLIAAKYNALITLAQLDNAVGITAKKVNQ